MNMYEIEEKMEEELDKERVEFAKNFLKNKRIELERLDKQLGELAAKLEMAEEEYDGFLTMTVDEVYDKYRQQSEGLITGNITCYFHDPAYVSKFTDCCQED